MDDNKFLLSWNDFEANAPNTFRKLWTDQDFTDVTLATEDDHQIRAHKVIISSCSQFFRNLLIKNPHPNPLIYLKGVRHHELDMVIKFIYHGQCHVENEDIPDFLATGIYLMINGLMETIDPKNQEPRDNFKRNESATPSETKHQTVESQLQKPNMTSSHIPFQMSSGSQHNVATQQSHLITQQQTLHEGMQYSCDQCDYKSTHKSSLRRHQQSQHVGVRYDCDQCEYKATTQSDLRRHQQTQHDGMQNRCDKCEYKATTHGNLRTHQKSHHEGVKYRCDQCDYTTAHRSDLRNHQKCKHEGVRYSCDQCDYTTAHQSNLRTHQKSQHDGVRYRCDQCNYTATTKGHLRTHRQSEHSSKTELSQQTQSH